MQDGGITANEERSVTNAVVNGMDVLGLHSAWAAISKLVVAQERW